MGETRWSFSLPYWPNLDSKGDGTRRKRKRRGRTGGNAVAAREQRTKIPKINLIIPFYPYELATKKKRGGEQGKGRAKGESERKRGEQNQPEKSSHHRNEKKKGKEKLG